MTRLSRLAALWLIGCGLVACTSVRTTGPGAVGITRKQPMMVPEEDIEKSAEAQYAREIDKARDDGLLNTDPVLVERVRTVMARLIPVTAAFRPDAAGWNWQVDTLTTDEVNAHATASHQIMVYSGLVTKLSLEDAELAAVLAHEISHVLREHAREQVSRAYAQQIAFIRPTAAASFAPSPRDLMNRPGWLDAQLRHTREQELEADAMGLELMARAGYDPRAAVTLWQKMLAAETPTPPSLASRHPSSLARITQLQARLPSVLPLYAVARLADRN